jgi:hypothetical protein
MPKPKRKLTAAEKRARKERKKNFMTIFIHGTWQEDPTPRRQCDHTAREFINRW